LYIVLLVVIIASRQHVYRVTQKCETCMALPVHISRTIYPDFTKLSVHVTITVVWSSSGDVAIRYVLPVYSFSHIRPCGACEGSAQNDLAKEARILHCSVYSNWLITRGSTDLISMTASFYRTASFVNAQCKIQTSDVNMSWLESLRKYSKVAKLQNCNEY